MLSLAFVAFALAAPTAATDSATTKSAILARSAMVGLLRFRRADVPDRNQGHRSMRIDSARADRLEAQRRPAANTSTSTAAVRQATDVQNNTIAMRARYSTPEADETGHGLTASR